MRDYLTLRLYGSMQSWGTIAVGEVRPSGSHPCKSAVLGLVAAGLGLDRADEAAQTRLATSYGCAVRIDAPGSLLRDYHTVQTPKRRKGAAFPTRRSELACGDDLGTILSTREYLADAVFTVCLWTTAAEPPHSLAEIRDALARPAFTPYLGRKSCPPGLPLSPRVGSFASLAQALEAFPLDREREFLGALPEARQDARVFWEGDDEGLGLTHRHVRRDQPLSRRRWQFAEREEKEGTILPYGP
jgi:CRISPR system Cascade subunit CasD